MTFPTSHGICLTFKFNDNGLVHSNVINYGGVNFKTGGANHRFSQMTPMAEIILYDVMLYDSKTDTTHAGVTSSLINQYAIILFFEIIFPIFFLLMKK